MEHQLQPIGENSNPSWCGETIFKGTKLLGLECEMISLYQWNSERVLVLLYTSLYPSGFLAQKRQRYREVPLSPPSTSEYPSRFQVKNRKTVEQYLSSRVSHCVPGGSYSLQWNGEVR